MHNYKTKIGPVKDHFIWLKVEIVELPALGRGEAVKVTLQSLLTTVNSWSGQCTVVLWTRGVGSSSTVDSVDSAECGQCGQCGVVDSGQCKQTASHSPGALPA